MVLAAVLQDLKVVVDLVAEVDSQGIQQLLERV
jgi:hypothetical protein